MSDEQGHTGSWETIAVMTITLSRCTCASGCHAAMTLSPVGSESATPDQIAHLFGYTLSAVQHTAKVVAAEIIRAGGPHYGTLYTDGFSRGVAEGIRSSRDDHHINIAISNRGPQR